MTADVTHLRPQVEHYDSCQRDVHGRAVMHFLSTGAADDITAANVRAWVKGWRETALCGCRGMKLDAASRRWRQAQQRWEASMTDANAEAVKLAAAEVDRLRGMA